MPALPLLLLEIDAEPLALTAPHAVLVAARSVLPTARLVWAEGDPAAPLLAAWFDGRERAYQRFDDLAAAYRALDDPFYRGTLGDYRFIYPISALRAAAPAGEHCRVCELRPLGRIGDGQRCPACYRLALLRATAPR